jgi:hypothetical protein
MLLDHRLAAGKAVKLLGSSALLILGKILNACTAIKPLGARCIPDEDGLLLTVIFRPVSQ